MPLFRLPYRLSRLAYTLFTFALPADISGRERACGGEEMRVTSQMTDITLVRLIRRRAPRS
ncbi:hypothetical protein GCM10009837_56040 [Streptomyces durmitorensis]